MTTLSLHKESAESAQHSAGSGGGLKPLLRLSWELLAITARFKKAKCKHVSGLSACDWLPEVS